MATRNRQYKSVSSDSIGNCLPPCNFRQHPMRSKCKIHHFRTLHFFVTPIPFVSKNQQINYSHPSALFSTVKDIAQLLLFYSKVINKNNFIPNPSLKITSTALQNFVCSHRPEFCPVQDLASQGQGKKLPQKRAGCRSLNYDGGTRLLFGTAGAVL